MTSSPTPPDPPQPPSEPPTRRPIDFAKLIAAGWVDETDQHAGQTITIIAARRHEPAPKRPHRSRQDAPDGA
jgi:hypothetical protein